MTDLMRMNLVEDFDEKQNEIIPVNIILGMTCLEFEDSIIFLN